MAARKKPVVVAITNQKGGIGKTSTAIALATLLNKSGHKTLLIDADAQCNASDTFHAVIDNRATLYDVLLEGEDLENAIQKTEYGDIVPGDALLRRADATLPADPSGFVKLDNAINAFGRNDYEFIVIDTAPALGVLTRNVLIAADQVIIPVSADRYAIKGLDELVQSIQAIKKDPRLNPRIRIYGLLLVAYPDRTRLGKQILDSLKNISDQLGTRIITPAVRRTIKINEAHAKRTPLIYYDDKCTAAQDYAVIVEDFIKETGKGKKG